MTAALLTFALQSSILLLAGIGSSCALRRRSAAVRHWMLAVAVFASATLPLLQVVAPNWIVSPTPTIDLALTSWEPGTPGRGIVSPDDSDVETPPAPGVAHGSGGQAAVRLFVSVWAAGALAVFAWLLTGLARLAWISKGAEPLIHPTWQRLSSRVSTGLGLTRRVLVLRSPHPGILAGWGWLRPRIVVPSHATEWSDRDVHIVLLHEMAHVARGDWAAQVAAECLCAVTWFSPLPWIASRRLRAMSEHACDDIVLRQGIGSHEYAERLVAIARTLGLHRRLSPALAAPAMARPSSLEGRVTAMLNTRLSRSSMSPRIRSLVAAAAFAVALPVAGLVVGAQVPAALSGSVLDPANRVVPNAEIILTNAKTQATERVRSDASGRFSFVGLPPGTYAMEARLPGFATLKGTVTVPQEGVTRDLSLAIGSVRETISIVVPANPPAPAAASPADAASPRPLPAPQPCTADATIGGQIRPPRKLRDVKPVYPERLRAGKIAGVVVVEGTLAADGTVKGLQVVETPHADLATSVAEAVGRWRFEPTLLNCQPMDIKIRVDARFAFE